MNTVPKTTVISLHGIRTRGKWQKDLQAALEEGGFNHRALDFGFFRALSLVRGSAREKKVRWFLDQYTQIRANAKGPISIVAHSFGSYIVAAAMRKYPQIKFDRILLCGSIVPVDYDWETVVHKRDQAKEVLNQSGKQDIWVRVAEWAVRDAGPSGYRGFTNTAGGRVLQQAFSEYSHSEYFFDLNFQDNWIPFLQGKGVPPQYNLSEGGANWKFRAFTAGLVGLVLIGGGLGYWYLRADREPVWVEPTVSQPMEGETFTVRVSANAPCLLNIKPEGVFDGRYIDYFLESEIVTQSRAGEVVVTCASTTDPAAVAKRVANVSSGMAIRLDVRSLLGSGKQPWAKKFLPSVQGEWIARDDIPPQPHPQAMFCTIAVSYEADLNFRTVKDEDRIQGDYEIREKRTFAPAPTVEDPKAAETCNFAMTGNPAKSSLELRRNAKVVLTSAGGDDGKLSIEPDFYQCLIDGAIACPTVEPGMSAKYAVTMIGDTEALIINGMEFRRRGSFSTDPTGSF